LKEDDNTVIKKAVQIIYNKIFTFGMAEWKQKKQIGYIFKIEHTINI
jgi:hypothetical protein